MSDYLSDEDCRRMFVAATRPFEVEDGLRASQSDLDAIRRVWLARPESARRLDVIAAEVAGTPSNMKAAYAIPTFTAIQIRGRELLKGEGE